MVEINTKNVYLTFSSPERKMAKLKLARGLTWQVLQTKQIDFKGAIYHIHVTVGFYNTFQGIRADFLRCEGPSADA
jgi:hypothetical protein